MKLTAPILLALSALVAASPAPNPAAGSELLARAPGCQDCKERFDFCFNVRLYLLPHCLVTSVTDSK